MTDRKRGRDRERERREGGREGGRDGQREGRRVDEGVFDWCGYEEGSAFLLWNVEVWSFVR